MHHEEEVRLIAYEIWNQEGHPDGHDLAHWLQAEAIWTERQMSQSEEIVNRSAVKRPRRTTATTSRTKSRARK